MSDSDDILEEVEELDVGSTKFTFSLFCDYLEKHKKGLDLKAFSGLLREFKADGEESVYPLLRLLLPSQDNRKFYLTSKGLTKILNSILHSPINVFNPTAEVFGSALYHEFHGVGGHESLRMVNRYLDLLAIRRSKRGQLFQCIGSKLGHAELVYFFRIILGEIAGFVTGKKNGSSIILQFISPSTKLLLSSGFSLKDICECIGDVDNTKNLANILILGRPIRPMLLSRLCSTNDGILKMIKNCGRPFYVETKFDGEHFIVHKMDKENYMYYSRKGNDYTDNFGSNYSSGFSSKIHDLFKNDVSDCVLDCEFVVWDTKKKTIVGKNRRTSDGNVLDVKYLDENPNFRRCLVVFDVLLLNGSGLMDRPLSERLGILNKNIFKMTCDGVLMISKQIEISKVSEFFQFYKCHMERGEEGVVVKGRSTVYRFGQRAIVNGWFKVKPDYGVKLTLDLALVGVKYDDVKHTKIKSFIIAAALGDGQMKIVGGVQCSLKKTDFEQLLQSIDLKAGSSKRPHFIQGFSEDKTVIYILADNVQVVEVKASGLINGRLQFPAITALRSDKFIDEINFYSDVMSYEVDLRENKRENTNEVFTLIKNKKRRVVPGSVELASNTHNGVKVYVVDDFHDSKKVKDLKETLRKFGFSVIENYIDSVSFVVSMGDDSRKSKRLTQIEDLNVIKAEWVDQCKDMGRIIPWDDSDYVKKSVCSRYQLELDEELLKMHEDPQTSEFNNIEDSVEYFNHESEPDIDITPVWAEESDNDIQKQMEETTLEEYPQLGEGDVFQELNFFMPFPDEKIRTLIENNGGNVLKHLNKGVTHIVFTQRYDFKADQLNLMPFLEAKMWQCVLTDENWLREAVHYRERYKDSLSVVEVSL